MSKFEYSLPGDRAAVEQRLVETGLEDPWDVRWDSQEEFEQALFDWERLVDAQLFQSMVGNESSRDLKTLKGRWFTFRNGFRLRKKAKEAKDFQRRYGLL